MKFIKLSNIVINTSKITAINMSDNKYLIHVLHVDVYGLFVSFSGGGFGNISSGSNTVTICKEKNLSDYTIITNWINMKTKQYNTKTIRKHATITFS
jgi:hypothetical protein